MQPYGSKRILANCKTKRKQPGSKIQVIEQVKNRKYGRKVTYNE